MRFPLFRLTLVSLLLGGSSCRVELRRNDWSDVPEPARAAFLEAQVELPTVDDPVEPYNRAVGAFNYGFAAGIVDPLADGYRFVVRTELRRRIGNVFENLRFPVRLFGNLLQANWGGAGRESSRFVINTTVGVLGIFDPATDWEIEPSDEDIGTAVAAWGWERSSYFALPFLGPSTIRDTCALPFDVLLDPATYVPGVGLLRGLNDGADKVRPLVRFVHTNYDPYERARLMWVLGRELSGRAYTIVSHRDSSVETLGAIYMTPDDLDFAARREERVVVSPVTGREVPYSLWLRPDPSPVVFIVPGLGGHRDADSAVAAAESAWNSGFSAVTVSSAMNWEFIERASSVAVPGFAPVDAADVHALLDAVARDLDAAWPGHVTGRALLGWSLGAFHALFIAGGATDPAGRYVEFDGVVALNPPVRLRHGLLALDRYFNAPLALPETERGEFIERLVSKVVDLYEGGELDVVANLPFTKMEAEFLIGLAFRITLSEVIMSSQNRVDLGVLRTSRSDWRRSTAYEEIREFSFEQYMLAFVLPYYRQRDSTIVDGEQLLGRCDLRPLSAALKGRRDVRVLSNENDFLLDPEDFEWLRDTFGADLHVEPRGGHLGNLHLPEVRARVNRDLSELFVEPRR